MMSVMLLAGLLRRRKSFGLGALAAVAAGAAVTAGAVASSRAAKPRPVLHEILPSPQTDADSEPTPLLGKPAGDGNPSAIAAGDKVLPAPPMDRQATDEPVLGTRDFGADRNTETAPDRSTDADSTLHYASVFNPDVLPFKRMSALDAVRDDYTLFVGKRGMTPVPVVGAAAGGARNRDRFWGSMPVKLSPGVDVPLPSVAPDMRILTYEIEPKVKLSFSKDGADNFYVRSDDASPSTTYRLVFTADADAGYFAPSLPTDRRYTAAMVNDLAPPRLRVELPPDVRAAAEDILVHNIKVSRRDSLTSSFNALVDYFRSFEAKDLTADSGDIYRDLCLTRAGVCRHRSFAFMVTANALGIPTRYVTNEAHAFVEVWFPNRNWQRVDLGGAALRLEVSGGDGKTLHRPRAEDPFSKPKEYRENYTQLEGDIKGLSQSQIADRRRPTSDAPASGDFDASGNGSGSGSGSGGGGGGLGSGSSASAANDPFSMQGRITPDKTLPVAPNDPAKKTPVLEITRADAVAYRGGALHLEGKATVGGQALPARPIDVFISPAGSGGKPSRALRRVLTGADGTFSADFDIPSDVRLAPYEIHISSPEDATYNASLSN